MATETAFLSSSIQLSTKAPFFLLKIGYRKLKEKKKEVKNDKLILKEKTENKEKRKSYIK